MNRDLLQTPRVSDWLVTDLPPWSLRDGLLGALLISVSALIAWPFANTVMGDDFSYMRTALDLAATGHLRYNGWASMMLGWQAVWGALFIHAFGFSFNVMRASMLPLAFISIYVFHGILVRFGVSRRDSLFGAVALGATPLFLPLVGSFMSDIPGLLSVLLCIAMCQRAVVARSDRATVAWLLAASAANLASGTVRQICWLGALVMVPSTAWLLRRRCGVLPAAAVSWAISLATVLGCVAWLNRQPWTVPEHLIAGQITLWRLGHLLLQFLKSLLFIVLLIAPVCVAFLTLPIRLNRSALLRVVSALAVAGVLLLKLRGTDHFEAYLMPWLVPTLVAQGMGESHGPIFGPVTLHLGSRVLLSLLVLLVGSLTVEAALELRRSGRGQIVAFDGAAFWMLVPFSVAVVALLSSRGMFFIIQDRYMLLLLPAALVGTILLYERATNSSLPRLCDAVLVLFAAYGVAGLQSQFARARAELRASAQVEATGVPRTAIVEGFGADEWVELEHSGHVNNINFRHSRLGTFNPNPPSWNLPEECLPFNSQYSPSFHPVYFIHLMPGPCFTPSGFAPVRYISWLPPFHRAAYTSRSVLAR